jgi:hypothetical protein
LIKLLAKKKYPRDKIERLFMFIDAAISLPQVMEREFDQEVKSFYEEEDTSMGLTWGMTNLAHAYYEEGEIKGAIKGKLELLLRLISSRISSLPEDVICEINSINDASKIDEILDNIFEIHTLEDLKKIL